MDRPKSLRQGHVARWLDGYLIVLSPDRRVHRLDRVAAFVYQHADGALDASALARGLRADGTADADAALVHAALDRLADAGLLEGRLAPPIGITRRALLQKLTGAAALAALVGIVGLPKLGRADNTSPDAGAPDDCADDAQILGAIAQLEADEVAIAATLDTFISGQIALATPPGPTYLAALRSFEAEHKVAASGYDAQLSDATEDLAECRFQGGPEQRIQAQEEKRKTYLDRRGEEIEKRLSGAQEADRKLQVQIAGLEATLNGNGLANPVVPQQGQMRQNDEQSAKVAQTTRQLYQLVSREMAGKATETGLVSAEARVGAQSEQLKKGTADRLLAAEERKKISTETFARTQFEQDEKVAGGSDYVTTVAKENENKAAVSGEESTKLR